MKIDIRLSLAGGAEAARQYEVAGLRLGCDVRLEPLEPFLAATTAPAEDGATGSGEVGRGSLVYRGPGWVGGRLRRVESWASAAGYRLRIDGAGEFRVSADGGRVERRPPHTGPPVGPALAAAVLGPCLALALALRGVFCLHAGAAGPAGRAVALVGESGSGKSTLAAALAAKARGWRRVGDDLLPMRLAASGVRALPRFPQPGLPPDGQWRPPAPAELELAAIYLLEPLGESPQSRGLSRREAVLALVRQTVAARLFAAELQGRHLDACAEVAHRVPVRSLRFARRPDSLPGMIAAIVDRSG